MHRTDLSLFAWVHLNKWWLSGASESRGGAIHAKKLHLAEKARVSNLWRSCWPTETVKELANFLPVNLRPGE